MRMRTRLYLTACLSLGASCGEIEDPQTETTSHSYRTTSNVGDLSTWTIEGNHLHVEWQDIAPVSGAVEKIYTVDALCGSVNADFGHRTCLVDGDAICADGTVACEPGDGPQDGETFTIFEVPGMALIVNVEDAELHAGFAAGDCSEVATDDYTFVNVGLGQREIFGLFRTDADFSTVHHMDFGFSDAPENQLSYTTGDQAGLVAGISASACKDGVRELLIEGSGETLRLVVTQAGHFVLDKPEGEGGLIAINDQNSAVIADFANKEFGGIVFPDDRGPELLSMSTGDVAGGRASITALTLSETGDVMPDTPVYINEGAMGEHLGDAFLEPDQSYASNQIVVDGNYPQGPSQLPGVFEIDAVGGDETAIIGVGATVDGRTLLFGAVVNEFEGLENAVKGNFILVEK